MRRHVELALYAALARRLARLGFGNSCTTDVDVAREIFAFPRHPRGPACLARLHKLEATSPLCAPGWVVLSGVAELLPTRGKARRPTSADMQCLKNGAYKTSSMDHRPTQSRLEAAHDLLCCPSEIMAVRPPCMIDYQHRNAHRKQWAENAAHQPASQAQAIVQWKLHWLHVLQIVPHRVRGKRHIKQMLDLCDEDNRCSAHDHGAIARAPYDVEAAQVCQDEADQQLWDSNTQQAPEPVVAADSVQFPLNLVGIVLTPPDAPVHPRDEALLFRCALVRQHCTGFRCTSFRTPWTTEERSRRRLGRRLWRPPQQPDDVDALAHVDEHPHFEEEDTPDLQHEEPACTLGHLSALIHGPYLENEKAHHEVVQQEH
mmetsp:Transcript_23996/g.60629  ORF Transcript_23996/g.60629 Transcript_23996/m.60629 type:complete len:373 (+) Transcript_23996:62-1180(+)